MGLFDSLFSGSSSDGSGSSWMKDQYKKFGLDMDNEVQFSNPSNIGTKMYCTMCHRIYIYNGGHVCPNCNNFLVEWDR